MRHDLAGLDFPAFSAWLTTQVGCAVRFHRTAFRALHTTGVWDPQAVAAWREVGSDARDLLARLSSLAAYDQCPALVSQSTVEDPEWGHTTKLLLRLQDGQAVETVSIPMARGGYRTVCVSTQVGCRQGCAFCRTARMGLVRQLSASEVMGQVLAVVRYTGVVPRNLVFMGMGEPLDNPEVVATCARIAHERCGLGMATGHITISTVGRLAGLRRLRELGLLEVNLAVSLHAADDAVRARLVPAARIEPVAALRAALLELVPSLPRGRRIMLSCVVIPGITDTPALLDRLAAWTQGMPALVNLIPFNPFPGVEWRAPTNAEVQACRDACDRRGLSVRLRVTKGADTLAACGQLATGL